MAKVRQPYPEVRFVPWIGRDVEPGEVVGVPDDELASYLEAGWEPADSATGKAGQKLLDEGRITVLAGATDAAAPAEPAPAEPSPATSLEGN